MINNRLKMLGIFAFCGAMTVVSPFNAQADQGILSGPGLENAGYIVTVDVDSVNINKDHESNEILTKAVKGSSYEIVEDMGDGWVKIKVGSTTGYLPVSGNATIGVGNAEAEEVMAADGEASLKPAAADASTSRRQQLVNYSLQFVGGKYKAGGSDPHTGADCSGFTSYVMKNGAGVTINRSSRSQATQGIPVSASQMRPGDLVFYGSGRGINHVALYIGNGQVVHASTYKTGIKISNWNYRAPVKIVNVLGD